MAASGTADATRAGARTWPFGALGRRTYGLIMADPPWPYELRSEKGETKSYAAHYGAMSFEEIAGLRVGELAAAPAVLLLWATGPMLPMAFRVMSAWGFVYKTELVWRKMTRHGRVRMGTGYCARTMHEPVLLGTIGSPSYKAFPSLFDGLAREHSRKPDELFALCEERFSDTWWVELFSRQSRPGWDTWGFEAGKFDPVVTRGGPAGGGVGEAA